MKYEGDSCQSAWPDGHIATPARQTTGPSTRVALPPSFHHFIVSRTSNKLNFISLHFISDRFIVSSFHISLHFISDRFIVSHRFISLQRIGVK
jgi:hypothetical protein